MPISANATGADGNGTVNDTSSPRRTTTLLSRPARLHHIMHQRIEDDGDLLDDAAASVNDRVLVVGGTTADLLCASVRRGCRSAMSVAKAPAHPEAAEVVVAPCVLSLNQAEDIAVSARKALSRGSHEGRLAMRLLGTATSRVIRNLVAHLSSLGFVSVKMRRTKSHALVVTGRVAAPHHLT